MKEYRAIRERHTLMEMFSNSELAAEITLQPVKALAVDAAIIFADILLPLDGMGLGLDFLEGEGPFLEHPVRSRSDVERLRVLDPEQDLGYVLRAVQMVSRELGGQVPLIGFAGAPFTLASYAIEGRSSRDFLLTKKFMHAEPETWTILMTQLADTILAFLKAQVKAGAQVVQLFDSWVGCLSPADYEQFVLPHARHIFQELEREGISSIHFGTGTTGLLALMAKAGGDVIGTDWRTYIDQAWNRMGRDVGIQGNLDPAYLFAPWDVLRDQIRDILDRIAGRPGHIFNLGHGILPATPVDSVKAAADFVHEYSEKIHR
jgi:uroporphyrinogen decarboxylase